MAVTPSVIIAKTSVRLANRAPLHPGLKFMERSSTRQRLLRYLWKLPPFDPHVFLTKLAAGKTIRQYKG